MQFLVRLTLASGARPNTAAEGLAFIHDYIFPTLERCGALQKERKIIAGGPETGTVALALIIEASSASELDQIITSLPVWPRMETNVTLLTTFDERRRSVDAVLEMLQSRARERQSAGDR